jgi:predicted Fe-S protein YdhL (DUF1289 family)
MSMAATDSSVPSPCVKICRMEPDGLCTGCLRNLREIAGWSSSDPEQRREILARVEQRKVNRAAMRQPLA